MSSEEKKGFEKFTADFISGMGKTADAAGKAVSDFAETMRKGAGKKVADVASSVVEGVGKTASDITGKAADIAVHSKEAIIKAVDVNGDREFNIEDVIIMSLRVPGIRIKRSDFLRKEFLKRYPSEVIEDAIKRSPALAGISSKEVDFIADEVIKYERNCVSGISAALGMPGGFAMAATIPADIAQYYGYMLRATQKLMYLYGFPEINMDENNQTFDSETINLLIICMGVMYGVAGANNVIKAMAKALASGVEKKLINTALTKGTFYPIVKSVAGWFGKRMTKEVFAGFFKRAIPVVGGVIGGAITFASFKPCCDKLKSSLRETALNKPELMEETEEE